MEHNRINENTTLIEELIIRSSKIYQDRLKPYQITRMVNNYVDGILPELYKAYRHADEDDEFSFNISSYREKIGMVKLEGTNRWVLDLMAKSKGTRLYDNIKPGKYGTNSIVRFNPEYKEKIMEELITGDTVQHLTHNEQQSIRENANQVRPVDLQALYQYITHTTSEIERLKPNGYESKQAEKYRNQLVRNVVSARQLLNITEEHEGEHFILEEWFTSDCGREYGKGYSLQSRHKSVRHAALGDCHKYDFKACAFAVLASIATSINPTQKVGAIEDYIRSRAITRKQISDLTGIPDYKVKTIFTSLGFGAKVLDNIHHSIRKEVTQDQYDKLVKNSTFKYIVEDLEEVKSTILNFEYFKQNRFSIDDNDESRAFTYKTDATSFTEKEKNRRLAWIYQCYESILMRKFKNMAESNGHKVILTTHDCLYFKSKLPVELTLEIKMALRKMIKLIDFEHEHIFSIRAPIDFAARRRELDLEEAEHKARIQAEEYRTSTNTQNLIYTATGFEKARKVIAKQKWDERKAAEYETLHKQQWLIDQAQMENRQYEEDK